MGAGRRTETVNFSNYTAAAGIVNKSTPPQRKLAERGRLGSVIFGCTNVTYNECVTNKLFGLPYSHHSYVDHIDPGMPLFLFNYMDRKLHGIFEATSQGALNINSYAWTTSDSGTRTSFPAQVRVQLRADFTRIVSIPEVVFKDAIIDNYFSPSHFFFEVDKDQTEKLIRLFERHLGHSSRQAPIVSKSPMISAPPINAWQTVKVWKKSAGCIETDEKLKMKKPATVIMSEWEKGAQYVSSSSKEASNSENHHQPSISIYSNIDEESGSESSEEGVVNSSRYKPSETAAQVEGKPHVDVKLEHIEVNHDVLPEFGRGDFRRKIVISDLDLSAIQKGRKDGYFDEEWSEAKKDEIQRVLGILQQITRDEVEDNSTQAELPPEVNTSEDVSEWERIAREKSASEQANLKEEREKLEATLGHLDSTVATTVKKNLELYSSALAQMREDGIELRHLLDEARTRSEEARLSSQENQGLRAILDSQATVIVSMKAKLASLEQKVENLTRQGQRSVTQQNGDYFHEFSVQPFDRQTLPEIYLIGGLGDQLSRLESVLVWSPSNDKLRTAAPMVTPRCCAGASVVDEHIYVFGGGDGSSWYDTVERYDPRLNEWRPCASMKTQRGSLGGVTVGDRIYAVGGGNGMASFSEVECFDPHLAAWLPCTSMLDKRFCVAAAELGGVLYALGGFDGEQYLMSCERFDPREALWRKLPSMNVKRGSLSAAVLNGRIYALGGYDGEGILDIVETFDPRADRWDTGPRMCCRRAYGAVAVVGDALYYLGGLSEDETVDPEQRSTVTLNGFHEDEGGKDGEDVSS